MSQKTVNFVARHKKIAAGVSLSVAMTSLASTAPAIAAPADSSRGDSVISVAGNPFANPAQGILDQATNNRYSNAAKMSTADIYKQYSSDVGVLDCDNPQAVPFGHFDPCTYFNNKGFNKSADHSLPLLSEADKAKILAMSPSELLALRESYTSRIYDQTFLPKVGDSILTLRDIGLAEFSSNPDAPATVGAVAIAQLRSAAVNSNTALGTAQQAMRAQMQVILFEIDKQTKEQKEQLQHLKSERASKEEQDELTSKIAKAEQASAILYTTLDKTGQDVDFVQENIKAITQSRAEGVNDLASLAGFVSQTVTNQNGDQIAQGAKQIFNEVTSDAPADAQRGFERMKNAGTAFVHTSADWVARNPGFVMAFASSVSAGASAGGLPGASAAALGMIIANPTVVADFVSAQIPNAVQFVGGLVDVSKAALGGAWDGAKKVGGAIIDGVVGIFNFFTGRNQNGNEQPAGPESLPRQGGSGEEINTDLIPYHNLEVGKLSIVYPKVAKVGMSETAPSGWYKKESDSSDGPVKLGFELTGTKVSRGEVFYLSAGVLPEGEYVKPLSSGSAYLANKSAWTVRDNTSRPLFRAFVDHGVIVLVALQDSQSDKFNVFVETELVPTAKLVGKPGVIVIGQFLLDNKVLGKDYDRVMKVMSDKNIPDSVASKYQDYYVEFSKLKELEKKDDADNKELRAQRHKVDELFKKYHLTADKIQSDLDSLFFKRLYRQQYLKMAGVDDKHTAEDLLIYDDNRDVTRINFTQDFRWLPLAAPAQIVFSKLPGLLPVGAMPPEVKATEKTSMSQKIPGAVIGNGKTSPIMFHTKDGSIVRIQNGHVVLYPSTTRKDHPEDAGGIVIGKDTSPEVLAFYSKYLQEFAAFQCLSFRNAANSGKLIGFSDKDVNALKSMDCEKIAETQADPQKVEKTIKENREGKGPTAENKKPDLPASVDTDGDGVSDIEETKRGTNPKKADTDGDGLSDYEEIHSKFNLDPTNPDSDGDGISDGDEMVLGTQPDNPDTDKDGLPDGREKALGTDPNRADTDGDGIPDGAEVQAGYDPLDAKSHPGLDDNGAIVTNDPDDDHDGVPNEIEKKRGTNPDKTDTDGDGLSDGEEARLGTNPLSPDTDGDGVSDADEIANNTNPLDKDTNNNGYNDKQDIDEGYSPNQIYDSRPSTSTTTVGGVPGGTPSIGSGGANVIINMPLSNADKKLENTGESKYAPGTGTGNGKTTGTGISPSDSKKVVYPNNGSANIDYTPLAPPIINLNEAANQYDPADLDSLNTKAPISATSVFDGNDFGVFRAENVRDRVKPGSDTGDTPGGDNTTPPTSVTPTTSQGVPGHVTTSPSIPDEPTIPPHEDPRPDITPTTPPTGGDQWGNVDDGPNADPALTTTTTPTVINPPNNTPTPIPLPAPDPQTDVDHSASAGLGKLFGSSGFGSSGFDFGSSGTNVNTPQSKYISDNEYNKLKDTVATLGAKKSEDMSVSEQQAYKTATTLLTYLDTYGQNTDAARNPDAVKKIATTRQELYRQLRDPDWQKHDAEGTKRALENLKKAMEEPANQTANDKKTYDPNTGTVSNQSTVQPQAPEANAAASTTVPAAAANTIAAGNKAATNSVANPKAESSGKGVVTGAGVKESSTLLAGLGAGLLALCLAGLGFIAYRKRKNEI